MLVITLQGLRWQPDKRPVKGIDTAHRYSNPLHCLVVNRRKHVARGKRRAQSTEMSLSLD
jgi:hypothetical protein